MEMDTWEWLNAFRCQLACLKCEALDLESPAAKVGGFRNPWKGRGVGTSIKRRLRGLFFFVDFYI